MATAGKPDDAVLFAGVSLVLGAVCRHLLRGTRVPYTIALLILGVVLGSLEYGTKGGLGKLGAGIRMCLHGEQDASDLRAGADGLLRLAGVAGVRSSGDNGRGDLLRLEDNRIGEDANDDAAA